MSLIRNERLKLLATYVNGMAIALFALGTLAPLFSLLYGANSQANLKFVAFVSLICLLASAALHYAASLFLKGLRQ